MKIVGVSHPVPKKYADRIYNHNKTVFVGKKCLKKVSKGDKFVIYESHGAGAYTGMATIVKRSTMIPSEILKKYINKLFVTENEFKEYAQKTKKLNVIEFENFERFINPVVPKKFVTMGGKYIYKDEYELIVQKKDK
ncbi:MAG: DUF365 domain-containing protein [Methanobacterium formicicum]